MSDQDPMGRIPIVQAIRAKGLLGVLLERPLVAQLAQLAQELPLVLELAQQEYEALQAQQQQEGQAAPGPTPPVFI